MHGLIRVLLFSLKVAGEVLKELSAFLENPFIKAVSMLFFSIKMIQLLAGPLIVVIGAIISMVGEFVKSAVVSLFVSGNFDATAQSGPVGSSFLSLLGRFLGVDERQDMAVDFGEFSVGSFTQHGTEVRTLLLSYLFRTLAVLAVLLMKGLALGLDKLGLPFLSLLPIITSIISIALSAIVYANVPSNSRLGAGVPSIYILPVLFAWGLSFAQALETLYGGKIGQRYLTPEGGDPGAELDIDQLLTIEVGRIWDNPGTIRLASQSPGARANFLGERFSSPLMMILISVLPLVALGFSTFVWLRIFHG
jgi:hypothetical protein